MINRGPTLAGFLSNLSSRNTMIGITPTATNVTQFWPIGTTINCIQLWYKTLIELQKTTITII